MGDILFNIITGFFKPIPYALLLSLGKGMGILFYYLLPGRKKITLSNLRLAYPHKTAKELRCLCKDIFKNIFANMIEMIKCYSDLKILGTDFISIEGEEYLKKVIDSKRGAVIISAHLGNFPLICMKLSMDGYPVGLIYRPFHSKFFGSVLPVMHQRINAKSIPDRPGNLCVKESLHWLKSGGLLFMQIDQNPPDKAGLNVDFFGYQIPTFRGPVTFAERANAMILPVFIVREENNKHKIFIDEPFELSPVNNEADSKKNLEKLSKITESYIKKYPEQWWWIHRRFKKAAKST
jgi:KDO2-lipid IV(A) lauroyltransferase